MGLTINYPSLSFTSGTNLSNATGGGMGDELVSELHGRWYTHNFNGKLFIATQPAAGVIALPTGAATASYALANPTSSNVNVIPVSTFIIETVAAGTPVLGGLVWSLVPQNSTAVTGTAITAQSLKLGTSGAGVSNGKAFTTATLPITPTVFLPLAQKWTGAVTVLPTVSPLISFSFEGMVILEPGTSMGLQQVAADTTNPTLQVGVVWYESPR